jgi:hypothetical protein
MRVLQPVDLEGLDIRAELARVRRSLAWQLQHDESPAAMLQVLATEDPVALADLVLGPRALPGMRMVTPVLDLISVLEAQLPPASIYRRLAELAGSDEGRLEVLSTAAERHPRDEWLVRLSLKVEGPAAGLTHLMAAVSSPGFGGVCQMYARVSAVRSLLHVAAETGRVEPAAALAAEGQLEGTAQAAAHALDADPGLPIVPLLAAIWGPELDGLMAAMVPLVCTTPALMKLASMLGGFPHASRVAGQVIRERTR